MCVHHLWFVCVFSLGVFLISKMTGACTVTTDLIVRVNVRTTTTMLNEDTHSVIGAIGVSHAAFKGEFRRND